MTAHCAGKVSFATKPLADAVRKKMEHGAVKVYRCKECRQWHIGSVIGSVKRVKGARSYALREENDSEDSYTYGGDNGEL